MTSNCMSSIANKFSAIQSYHLGSIRISRTTDLSSYNSIVTGLTLWYGVILDYNSMFCLSTEASQNRGRILKHALTAWDNQQATLQSLLTSLDELGDLLLGNLSSSYQFKADTLLKELTTWNVSSWLAPLKGVLLAIFRDAFMHCEEGNEVRVIRAIRQISCFLKKLDVNRPDLQDQMRKEFIDYETFLHRDVQERTVSSEYQDDVLALRTILLSHLDQFTLDSFVPGHGPGAVANTDVGCWHKKNVTSMSDKRVSYLLDHAGLGKQSDYLPYVNGGLSDRTSRFVCVPKTWKKLRGISAEPSELQFWQQGVLQRIDSMFLHDKWWKSRVNLHDQSRSRRMALEGSLNEKWATVDLSAASDSVTLQLVRDLFGNTHLGRWLLGTRSTHTKCDMDTIRISKFAPMGSACCFPVECMVFALAAEVAVYRTHKPSTKNRQICVYGDDIILPSYAVHELFSILDHLGFSVNKEKSFWSGGFREACGVEAWHGLDIAPCRFSACVTGIKGRNSDHAEITSLVAFANELFDRGLHDTREFLLTILFNKEVRLGKSRSVRVQKTIFATFSGESQTLASPFPTNFNLEKKFSRPLQTKVYKRLVWQERPNSRSIGSTMLESYSVCEYTAWLIRHQPGVRDFDELWCNGWLDVTDVNPYARLPIGVVMVPTEKWALPVSRNSLG